MLAGILLNVTDEQLLASKYVTLIFIFILVSAVLINLFQLARRRNRPLKGKIINFLLIIGCAAGIMYSANQYNIENNLLENSQFIIGTTKGFCNVPLKGDGIKYEYVLNGQLYSACITFHPIFKSEIKVPDGKYYVRISEKYPGEGRMDFSRPVTIN